MTLIDVLEFFEIFLHKDVEAFRADEVSKQKIWNSIGREFTEKENKKVSHCLERQWNSKRRDKKK